MSHAPGPWKAVFAADISGFDDDHGVAWIESASGETVMATDSGRINQNEANARLIAAAPDLLDALESLLAVCVEELDEKRTPEMQQARDTIRKATGQLMPDITMCPGTGCPLRERCYRYLAEPSEQQSWADFTKCWHRDNESLEPECQHYIPTESGNHESSSL